MNKYGICNICNTNPVIAFIPAEQMRSSLAVGFQPTRFVPASALESGSDFLAWKQMLDTHKSVWGLCAQCREECLPYLPASAQPIISQEGTSVSLELSVDSSGDGPLFALAIPDDEVGNAGTDDNPQARKKYENASASAAQGEPDAMYTLGLLYDTGRGVAKDEVEARRWYEKAAASGHARAMYVMGILYANGSGLPRDYAQARNWFERSAAAGDASAMCDLGALWANGKGVPRDQRQAHRWLEKAAVAGNARAMKFLSILYEVGRGVRVDHEESRRWLEKAGEAGDVDATLELGLVYANGQGVPQDHRKARHWWNKAAAAGNADAQLNLGVLYAEGLGGLQDHGIAQRLWEKAAAAGITDAMLKLGLSNIRLPGFFEHLPPEYEKARRWFESAAAEGNSSAMFWLGHLYMNGLGVTQDLGEARQWLEKALAGGQHRAKELLERLDQTPAVEEKMSLFAYLPKGKPLTLNDEQLDALQKGIALEFNKHLEREESGHLLNRCASRIGIELSESDIQALTASIVTWFEKKAVTVSSTTDRAVLEEIAKAGDPEAMFRLGALLLTGESSSQDREEALHWVKKAAGSGNPEAMYGLGLMYENGEGVHQDYREARSWYTRAVAAGNANARKRLQELSEVPDERQETVKEPKAITKLSPAARAATKEYYKLILLGKDPRVAEAEIRRKYPFSEGSDDWVVMNRAVFKPMQTVRGKSERRELPKISPENLVTAALENFRCPKCKHPFGEDNPFYPKDGVVVPNGRRNMTCARCGETIAEFRWYRSIGFPLVGVVVGWVIGAVSADGYTFGALGAIVGAAVGVAVEFYARDKLKRRLTVIASEQGRQSRGA